MNIDIEDYIDEASTDALVSELKTRKGYENIEPDEDEIEFIESARKFFELSDIGKIRDILGLKQYSTKQEIINEINDL